MREILFRGQTRKKGEKVRLDGSPIDSNWVYGGIFPNNKGGDFAIIYQQEQKIEKFTVYADKVGQYTGLLDKNGKKIFEGDAVWFSDEKERGVVCFDEIGACFSVRFDTFDAAFDHLYSNELEIIGNVYDNPELMEGGE